MKKTRYTTLAATALSLAACNNNIAPEDATCRQIDESTFEIVSEHDDRVIASTNDAVPFTPNPSFLRGTLDSNFDLSSDGHFRVQLGGEEPRCYYRNGDWTNNYQLVLG